MRKWCEELGTYIKRFAICHGVEGAGIDLAGITYYMHWKE